MATLKLSEYYLISTRAVSSFSHGFAFHLNYVKYSTRRRIHEYTSRYT